METLFESLMRGVVTVLNGGSRDAERAFIQAFEKIDPEMAEEIEKRLFVLDGIVELSDESVQRVLREIETGDLAKALKAAAPETHDKIARNMSKRAGDQLKKAMDEAGPVEIEEVESAQQRIIGAVRRLEAAGEIVVPRG